MLKVRHSPVRTTKVTGTQCLCTSFITAVGIFLKHSHNKLPQMIVSLLFTVLRHIFKLMDSYSYTVLEIKKYSRLSLFQKPGNQSREFGCPDESLVAR